MIGFIGFGVYILFKDNQKREQEKENKVKKFNEKITTLWDIEGFDVTQRFISADFDTGLVLDEQTNRLCIIYSQFNEIKILKYRDILAVEVIEDNESVNKTSRSSQIGGALIGSVVAGGVGAIIGGLSGKSISSTKIKKLDLKIVVNDISQPVYILNFMNCISETTGEELSGVSKDDPKYKDALKNVTHWHSLISVLIKRADEEDKEKERQDRNDIENISKPNSVDELFKLSQLLKEGFITQEEYEKQKAKILA
ncbi:SHOCT domain-containing protein [Paenibacillus sp. MSJ-34]|uniref:SHOCT domain-containing protein n=1 Tax=Paenibacillus sp. MSJ-34 TaxID=2841529 RepID=UPI001C0F8C17|nr:SHOCT domain-containing protein [Paenibacillus sp. MSJ-34]MBU5441729.1 SHOCT domain-containing protein [Paenibacillus sp. MSJ-34]